MKNKNGFTLLELLVVVLIIINGIVGIEAHLDAGVGRVCRHGGLDGHVDHDLVRSVNAVSADKAIDLRTLGYRAYVCSQENMQKRKIHHSLFDLVADIRVGFGHIARPIQSSVQYIKTEHGRRLKVLQTTTSSSVHLQAASIMPSSVSKDSRPSEQRTAA